MKIRKAMRIAQRASLAYFHLRHFAERYRRKRRYSAAPDDPVLMFSRERPARSTAPSVLLSAVEMPPLFQNGCLLFFLDLLVKTGAETPQKQENATL